MNVFGDIYGAVHGPRLQRKANALHRSRAEAAVLNMQTSLEEHKINAQRNEAIQRQSLAARGLGKSSIADQDTARLKLFNANRLANLEMGLHVAIQNRDYVKAMIKYKRKQYYAQQLDNIVNTGLALYSGGILGGGGGGSGSFGSGFQTDKTMMGGEGFAGDYA